MASPASPSVEKLRRAIAGGVVGFFNDAAKGQQPIRRPTTRFARRAGSAWKVHADLAGMMVGGVAALLWQMLHPKALAGVWDHSRLPPQHARPPAQHRAVHRRHHLWRARRCRGGDRAGPADPRPRPWHAARRHALRRQRSPAARLRPSRRIGDVPRRLSPLRRSRHAAGRARPLLARGGDHRRSSAPIPCRGARRRPRRWPATSCPNCAPTSAAAPSATSSSTRRPSGSAPVPGPAPADALGDRPPAARGPAAARPARIGPRPAGGRRRHLQPRFDLALGPRSARKEAHEHARTPARRPHPGRHAHRHLARRRALLGRLGRAACRSPGSTTSKAAVRAAARSPRLAFGELYMDGRLTIEQGEFIDLLSMVVGANRFEDGGHKGRLKKQFGLLKSLLPRRNDATASRRNVAHHYDLDERALPPLPRRRPAVQLRLFPRSRPTASSRRRKTRRRTSPPSSTSSRASACSTSAAAGAGWRSTSTASPGWRCSASP